MTTNPFDNQEFRKEFTDTLGDMFDQRLTPLAQTVADHNSKLEKHGRDITQIKTVGSVLAFIAAFFMSGLEWVLHKR